MKAPCVLLLWLVGLATFTGCLRSDDVAISKDSASPLQFGEEFWKHWGDGRAELAGYRLTTPRYGQSREGTAVLIFVTETFRTDQWVKAHDVEKTDADTLPVMKLNQVKDFQTGIYDYNMMTSSFVALQDAKGVERGTPVKVSFSSQEWCGQVYHQLRVASDRIEQVYHSYFDGEADHRGHVENRPNALLEDAMWHWVRGLAEPHLALGETRVVDFLPSLERTRLEHRSLTWTKATLGHEKLKSAVSTPMGEIDVDRYTVSIDGGLRWTFLVERASPKKIIRWENSAGERAELQGAMRLKYWELTGPKGASYLTSLGLRGL